jgi:nucleotide-binding universal stress UspA family protein
MLKVLLPIDDAGKVERALAYLAICQSESRWPIEVHVLHVEPPLSSYVASKLPAASVRRYHEDHSQEVLRPAADAFTDAGIPHRTHALTGDPVQSIVRFARDKGVDRIVMVTYARETLPEVLLGSVTAGVLQLSPVPVEVVPMEGSRLRVYARAAGAGATFLTLVYLALE